jgi:CRISPR-associated protein Cas2
MSLSRLNQYRIMWVFVFFDLPTQTQQARKNYTKFRKCLEKDGFTMFQYSIYIRHCSSRENAEVHIKRTKNSLPPEGHVCILQLTDKQFGMIELFAGKKESERPVAPHQLKLF